MIGVSSRRITFAAFFNPTLVHRDMDVITGQQSDSHPGRLLPIQDQLQGTFGCSSGGSSGGKACAKFACHYELIFAFAL